MSNRPLQLALVLVAICFATAAQADMRACSAARGAPDIIASCGDAIRDAAAPQGSLVAAYRRLGAAYLLEADIASALRSYEEGLRRFPDAAPLYSARGEVHALRWDHRAAIADYTEALRRDPGFAEALAGRGLSLGAIGQEDAALADFEAALRIQPDNGLALGERANLREVRGDIDGALADYERAALIDSAPAAPFSAGRLRFLRGEYSAAATHFAEAFARNQAMTEAAVWYLVASARQGRYPQAFDAVLRSGRVDLARWPGPLLALASRQAEADAVQRMASRSDRHWADFAFFWGFMSQITGPTDAGKKALMEVVELDGKADPHKVAVARAELQRLGVALPAARGRQP